jgi:excisionase family DNA binding protein
LSWSNASRRFPSGPRRALEGGAGRLPTVREAAERLAVSTFTVYGLCDRGELPHVRVSNAIRIAPADLAALLAGQRAGGR